MKKLLNSSLIIFFLIIIATFSCKKNKEDLNQLIPPTPLPTNKVPIANAGVDLTITLPQDSVVLDGTQSSDPDGIVTSYHWSKIYGPASFIIRNPSSGTTLVDNLREGVYQFELRVTDNKGSTAKDIVQVTVFLGTGECGLNNLPQLNATLTQIGNLSFPQSPYVAAAGTKIVFAGGDHGLANVDIYDINQHVWTRTALSQARTNMAVVSCENKIFFAGGNNYDNWYDIVDIYDVSTGTWTVNHLSEPKSFIAAASIGDKVFFAGGMTDEGWNQTSQVDIYDISDNAWSVGYLSEPKIGGSTLTANNKIYFAGGWNYLSAEGDPLNSVDIYDAITGTWSVSLLNNISGGVSGVQHDNKIYWGGINYSTGEGKIEIWNTQNNAINYSCLSYPRIYPSAIEKNNDIIFFSSGKWLSDDVLSDRFDILNSITGEKSIGLLNHAMSGAGIISVNNVVYIAGGKTANGYTDKVYILSW